MLPNMRDIDLSRGFLHLVGFGPFLFQSLLEQIKLLTLPMLRLPYPKHKDAKIFEKYLNPVMLVFIR